MSSSQGRIDKWQLLDLLKAINQPPEDEEAHLVVKLRLAISHAMALSFVPAVADALSHVLLFPLFPHFHIASVGNWM